MDSLTVAVKMTAWDGKAWDGEKRVGITLENPEIELVNNRDYIRRAQSPLDCAGLPYRDRLPRW